MTTPALPRRSDARWRLALGILAVLVGVLLCRLAIHAPEPLKAEAAAETGAAAVHFTITRPEALPVERDVPWSEGQTVAEATGLAAETIWRGAGTMALLVQLDGVPNQGPEGLNWQFEVNGRYATEGAGAVRLTPGDRVLWKLAPYE